MTSQPGKSAIDTEAVAARLVAAIRYMTIATADADGRPWAPPVWYAAASNIDFLWVSAPTARHSRNIAARPQVAIVIFDSTVPEGAAEALYLEGTTRQLGGDELADAIAAFSARSQARAAIESGRPRTWCRPRACASIAPRWPRNPSSDPATNACPCTRAQPPTPRPTHPDEADPAEAALMTHSPTSPTSGSPKNERTDRSCYTR